MISRVAGTCFWMHRHLERAENMARLVRVNRSFVLDMDLPSLEQWYPLVLVAGEQKRFAELFPPDAANDGEVVQDYLTWDERNPASIVSSSRRARENGRTIREVISREMWETLNGFLHWLQSGVGKRMYRRDRNGFYQHVQEVSELFQGQCQSTLLYEEPLDFMRLGMYLERAGQTARILDVKHHTLGPSTGGVDTPIEVAQWIALLYSCSAMEPFFKHRHGPLSGATVADFLLNESSFPRSVLHCLNRARDLISQIRDTERQDIGHHSSLLLDRLVDHLRSNSMDLTFDRGIHKELEYIVGSTAEICDAIESDYFAPSLNSGKLDNPDANSGGNGSRPVKSQPPQASR